MDWSVSTLKGGQELLRWLIPSTGTARCRRNHLHIAWSPLGNSQAKGIMGRTSDCTKGEWIPFGDLNIWAQQTERKTLTPVLLHTSSRAESHFKLWKWLLMLRKIVGMWKRYVKNCLVVWGTKEIYSESIAWTVNGTNRYLGHPNPVCGRKA